MDYLKIKKQAERLGVTPEVYLALRQSNRKMRYFERDLKSETIVIENDRVTFLPSREDSLERLFDDEGVEFAAEEKSVDEIVAESIMAEQLRNALDWLSDGERRLIKEIFFANSGEGQSERKVAESLGVAQKTVNYQKQRILKKLKKLMELKK